jgi:hypothetical protein
LMVKCEYVGSEQPSCNGLDNSKAHPGVMKIVSRIVTS